MKQPLYKELAQAIDAYRSTSDLERQKRHAAFARAIVRDRLLSGSECRLDVQASTAEKIVIISQYHGMNAVGRTMVVVIVRPSLTRDIDIHIVGPFGKDQDLKDQDLKDHLTKTFDQALRKEYER
jgi:hypothetical protein